MTYLICCSKKWFYVNSSRKFKNKKHIKFIFDKKKLNSYFLKKINPKIIFFVHWSTIIPKEIYLSYNCITFHTSNLPYGRGGSPIQNLILRNIKNTYICAIKTEKYIDAGPIYLKKKLSLNGSLNEIFIKISKRIEVMINSLIKKIPKPKKQTGKIVKFKRLKNKNLLRNKNLSLNKIYDHIRMLDHNNYPRTFLKLGKFKFSFSKVKKLNKKLICETIIKED